MADDELQAAEAELEEQLRKHAEALQGVRHALQADPGNAQLVEVRRSDVRLHTCGGAHATGIRHSGDTAELQTMLAFTDSPWHWSPSSTLQVCPAETEGLPAAAAACNMLLQLKQCLQ